MTLKKKTFEKFSENFPLLENFEISQCALLFKLTLPESIRLFSQTSKFLTQCRAKKINGGTEYTTV